MLAFHTDGAWYVGNQRLERIVCQGRVRVEFEIDTGRRSLGPFEEFSLTGDTAISTHGVVARYRPLEQTWYVDRYDSECESLIVRANATLAAA